MTKFIEGTTDKVQGVKFRVKGKGLSTSGRVSYTNKDGQITLKGLYPNEVYSITEEYAKGFEYSETPVEFKTFWDGTELKAEVISGTFKETPAVDNEQEGQPILHVSLDNKKLREYDLELTKYEKNTDKVLKDAVFNIEGKWLDDEFETNENGKLRITGLYENIEYTLIENFAPEGYLLENQVIKFIGTFDENNRLIIKIIEGTLIEEKDKNKFDTNLGEIQNNLNTIIEGMEAGVCSDENGTKIFTVALENEPLFKLIKTDGTTNELMPNVKFAIKKINDDKTEVDAVDTKGNLIGEEYTINETTYRVVETDENGEIAIDLPEGIYRAIEVETLAGYVLEEDIEVRSYKFAIGPSKPAEKELVEEFTVSYDSYGKISYADTIQTDDGFLEIGQFTGTVQIPGETVASGETLTITAVGQFSDAIIIKRNNDGKVEWYRTYKNNHTEAFTAIDRLNENQFIVTGYRGVAGTKEILHVIYDLDGNLLMDRENMSVIPNDAELVLKAVSDG